MDNEKEEALNEAIENNELALRSRAEQNFWRAIATLLEWKRFIIVTVMLVAVGTILISLTLTKWYKSSTRLLAPESSSTSPISAAMLRNLSSAASAFLGGGFGADFDRYLSILTSRTLAEELISTFDLITVYELDEAEFPIESAIEMLADNSEFTLDLEYGYLSISVYDTDPRRAADMANYYAAELNRINMLLTTQTATSYRKFVERRYNETLHALDSLKLANKDFQEEYGIFDLQIQAEGFLEQLANIRTEEIALEIQYQSLLSQFGEDNQQVRRLKEAYQVARDKRIGAIRGHEQILPLPQEDLPHAMKLYLDLEQETMIQKSILEVVAPLFDQARFQEEREYQAVQILDEAVPPVLKAKPKRSIIVIMATMSALALAVVYVFLFTWWQQNHQKYGALLREARNFRTS